MTNTHSKIARPGTTLVIGGTGKTGRRIVAKLTALGAPVRAASRSTTPSFDWNDRDNWPAALEGVSALYVSYSPDLAIPGATDAVRALVAEAKQAGVRRIVLLSGRGEEEAQRSEQIVQDSGLDWTIVRASWFNQNFSEGEFLGMVQDGVIALPASDVPEPFVDADDIADVAVAALTEEGHAGQLYEVTGPRLMTFDDVVAEMSEVTGREIRFVSIPQESFAAGIAASGAPADIAWLLDYLFATILDGRNAFLGDGVQRSLGREPKDFREYLDEVAATGLWKSASTGAAA